MMSATLDTHALGRLVSEAQQGDRTAADRLVREHERWVRSVVYAVTGRAELVEDIAQQVWSRAWQRSRAVSSGFRGVGTIMRA
jgi:DNA-directed RNA polymerase specialized sigma24 family protein